MLASFYVSSAGHDLCLVANGYFAKPFDRFQIVSVVERFVKNKGRMIIVSPEKEEARNLQVLLGAEGYDVTLYADGDKAVRGRDKAASKGVVIGSFPQLKLERLLKSLMGDARIRALPWFLLLEENCFRHVTTVALNAASREGGEGISSLVMAIEKSYAKAWATASAGGGS